MQRIKLVHLLAALAAFVPGLAKASICSLPDLGFTADTCVGRQISFVHQGNPDSNAGTSSFDPLTGVLAGVSNSGLGALAFADASAGTLRLRSLAESNGVALPPFEGPATMESIGAVASGAFRDSISIGGPVGGSTKASLTIDVTAFLTGNSSLDVNARVFRGAFDCILGCGPTTLVAVLAPGISQRTISVEVDSLTPGEVLFWSVSLNAVASVNNANAALLSLVDARHTLHLFFDVDNPAFSVTSASGHDYRTSAVPLPGSLWFAVGSCGLLATLRRRRVAC